MELHLDDRLELQEGEDGRAASGAGRQHHSGLAAGRDSAQHGRADLGGGAQRDRAAGSARRRCDLRGADQTTRFSTER